MLSRRTADSQARMGADGGTCRYQRCLGRKRKIDPLCLTAGLIGRQDALRERARKRGGRGARASSCCCSESPRARACSSAAYAASCEAVNTHRVNASPAEKEKKRGDARGCAFDVRCPRTCRCPAPAGRAGTVLQRATHRVSSCFASCSPRALHAHLESACGRDKSVGESSDEGASKREDTRTVYSQALGEQRARVQVAVPHRGGEKTERTKSEKATRTSEEARTERSDPRTCRSTPCPWTLRTRVQAPPDRVV